MELPRRELLKGVTGLTAASMLVPAAAGRQQVVASNARPAGKSEFSFDCFANLRKEDTHSCALCSFEPQPPAVHIAGRPPADRQIPDLPPIVVPPQVRKSGFSGRTVI